MTLVIEVTPELESRLQQEAAKRGLPVPECARVLLEGVLAPPACAPLKPMTPEERAARVDAVVGKYADIPGSVDEFLRSKQEEIDLEEARWRRWHKGAGQ